jgi:prolyl oligopeptidase PreP (S9A serine peptidase family)
MDDYRRLENSDDPKVKMWVAAQNASVMLRTNSNAGHGINTSSCLRS